MKLVSFQIENYRSIVNSGIVNLSDNDNVTILAGQNESGKSSILRALKDFERGEFENDSQPFFIKDEPIQKISCSYRIEKNDNFYHKLQNEVIKQFNIKIAENERILNEKQIEALKTYTIIKTREGNKITTSVNEDVFNIISSASIKKVIQQKIENGTRLDEAIFKYINITAEDKTRIAKILCSIAPKIIFFDDFCDLLPDRIHLTSLETNDSTIKGYKAVKNVEKILGINFMDRNTPDDARRKAQVNVDNKKFTIDFQKAWGQRIHGENRITFEYDFEKRIGTGENGSYFNFYVITKENQRLHPKQRSKGLIWFLSLWLELEAQNKSNQELILLLDEPDLHLHVKAQKDVLKLINKLSKDDSTKKGNQIIIATHSPYLIESDNLNRIKLIINDEKEGTIIEDIVSSKIDTINKKDALQPIANAIGLNVNEFSILQRKNIILEGISDFYYFNAMKKTFNYKGDYYFVPCIGVRKINSIISLCIGYGLDWIAIIDDDPTEGGNDSKKKFDEIKDYIFDGDENEAKKRIHILKDIRGIENMFSFNDLKLIDLQIKLNSDLTKVVGENRKIFFSKLFFEKVNKGEIKLEDISNKAKENFNKAFNFINSYFESDSILKEQVVIETKPQVAS